MTVNAIIGGFNARWDESLTPEQERERFDAAVALARGILSREVAAAASGLALGARRARGDRRGRGPTRGRAASQRSVEASAGAPRRLTPCS